MIVANITGEMIDHLKELQVSGLMEEMIFHFEKMNKILIDIAADDSTFESMEYHIRLLKNNFSFMEEMKEFLPEEDTEGGSI